VLFVASGIPLGVVEGPRSCHRKRTETGGLELLRKYDASGSCLGKGEGEKRIYTCVKVPICDRRSSGTGMLRAKKHRAFF
jgi:hypothetical protein